MPPPWTAPLHRPSPQRGERQVFTPHTPIVIADGAEHRITGIASDATLDRYGTVVNPAGMREPRGPVALLHNHNRDRLAGVIELIDQQVDRIVIVARITDDDLWEDVVSGALSGLSVGFIAYEWTEDDPPTITDWEVVEVSLTPTPANPSAVVHEARTMPQNIVNLPARVIREVPAAAPSIGGRFRNARFHLSSVIAAAVKGELVTGFEREVIAELDQRSDTETRGVRVPASIFQRQSPHYGARAVSTDIGSAAALSPQEWLTQLLDDLSSARRWGVVSNRLGFVIVSSLRETVHVPKRETRVQAGWGQKDAVAPESDTTFDEDSLTPLYAKVTVTIRRSALRYSDPAVDAIVTRDIGEGLDDAIDQGLLFGTGANEMPVGLLTKPSFVIDKAGEPPTYGDILDIKGEMTTRWKIDDVGSQLRWALNPLMYDRMRTISVKEITNPGGEWFTGIAPSSASEGFIAGVGAIQSGRFERRLLPPATGQPVFDTHLVKGDMGVIVYFGGASVDLIIDPYTLSTSGAVRLTGFVDVNCTARDPNVDMMLQDCGLTAPPSGP
jgi:hypothetical protein